MSLVSKRIRDLPRDPDVHCVNCGHPEAVWAHLPYHDAGVGQKCDDVFGAPLCSECHDYVDGRRLHDRTGYGHPNAGRMDYEWQYRVLRRGLKLLLEAGIVEVQ